MILQWEKENIGKGIYHATLNINLVAGAPWFDLFSCLFTLEKVSRFVSTFSKDVRPVGGDYCKLSQSGLYGGTLLKSHKTSRFVCPTDTRLTGLASFLHSSRFYNIYLKFVERFT